ncbi:MAG TPA: glycosyltransferase [Chloroflexota bacterium]|nr:glycosyltransferase [Chloroflexota bacterium]
MTEAAARLLTEPEIPSAELAAPAARRRVCIISEDFPGVLDEGKKKFAFELARALAGQHDALALTTRGVPAFTAAAEASPSRTFLNRRLRAELVRHRPEIIVYLALSSTGFGTFLRCRLLKAYCPRARVVLIGLQPRRHTRLQQRLIRHLAPDLVCVQTPGSKRYVESLGCRVELLPSGVDVERFQPVTPARRRELKASRGLDPDLPVALHVGHMQAGRGVRLLAELAAAKLCQVVLVVSSSTVQEPELDRELREAGVVVLSSYQPDVEQLYQLADCYVFPVPVVSTLNSIEVPLSVLEAFACELPVVTSRFGGLPLLFERHAWAGLVFADSPPAIVAETLRLCRSGLRGNRSLAEACSWEAIASGLLERVLNRLGDGASR